MIFAIDPVRRAIADAMKHHYGLVSF